MRVNRTIGSCFAVLLYAAFPAASSLAADDASRSTERAILVLDASGSMSFQR